MRTRVRVFVSGRVQGVFFRTSCADRARGLEVDGWIRNLPDGRVEAVFEGPQPNVDGMVTWCRHGPGLSRVDAVEVHRESPIGESGFRVR